MEKWQNQRAWFLVMPVVLLVAFNALIPLMTVVNYSVQDIFDSTHRLFVGTEWYRETLLNTRLQNALLRQLVFSGLVLLTNRMAPAAVFLLPVFQLYSALGLLDTYIASLSHTRFSTCRWRFGFLKVSCRPCRGKSTRLPSSTATRCLASS
jgi:ABC-type sugar transport system permease subunit